MTVRWALATSAGTTMSNLLINATYKSELAEGRGGAGLFLFNLRTKNIKPVWTGDGTADYGGSEGGSSAIGSTMSTTG